MLQRLRVGLARMLVTDLMRDAGDDRFWGSAGSNTEAGALVGPATLFELPTARDCINTIAGSISSVPVEVFEIGKDGALSLARDHPLADVFAINTSEDQTPADFWRCQVTDFLTRGNSYAEIVPGERGFVDRLLPIAAERSRGATRSGEGLYYRFGGLSGSAATVDVPGYRLMHVRSSPRDASGIFGRALYELNRETLGKALAVNRYGARFFKNSGASGGTIELGQPFKNEDQEKRWLAIFRAWRTGSNQHSDFLLPVGAKYNRQTVNNNEAQFLETKQDCDLDICRLFGVPPHKVGILENTTFNNIEHQSIQYVADTLVPIITLYEQAARLSLIADPRRYLVRFNVAALMRGDQASRFLAYQIGLLSGFLTINEVRRAEGLNGIGPAGDMLMRPLNMETVQVDTAMRALRAGDLDKASACLHQLCEAAAPAAFVPLARNGEHTDV